MMEDYMFKEVSYKSEGQKRQFDNVLITLHAIKV
jgi:hypothetical protein